MCIRRRKLWHISLVASGYLLGLFALAASLATAQSSSIHQQIQKTYNFQPHSLTTAEIQQKSGMLDQFWTEAKSKSHIYIPALTHIYCTSNVLTTAAPKFHD
jgi:hypothetical protein